MLAQSFNAGFEIMTLDFVQCWKSGSEQVVWKGGPFGEYVDNEGCKMGLGIECLIE